MINLLLLEDSLEDAKYYMRFCLPKEKVKVTHFTKVAELKAPDIEVPDVIISDLNLLDSWGEETITTIRFRFPNSPLIILTGDTNPSHIDAGLSLGVYSFLEKDKIDSKTLIREINFALRRAELEVRLKKAKQEAERHSSFKSTFLAHFSHEIRTPLNVIIGASNLLQETSLDTNQKDLIESQTLACDRLLTIVNDILDISKIEAGHVHIQEEDFEIRKLVRDCLHLYYGEAQKSGVLLSDFISPDIPSVIKGDSNRVKQILMNYVSNAIKYAPGQPVEVRVSMKNGEIIMKIQDSGEGIPPEACEKLFSSFVQADIKHMTKGTGLGLHVSKKLAQLMNGDAGVTSQIGQGSCFWFSFRPPKIKSSPNTRQAETKTRILLVIDNEVIGDIHKRQLESRLIHLDTTSLESTKTVEANYDLIIVDASDPSKHTKVQQLVKNLGSRKIAFIGDRSFENSHQQTCLVSPFSHWNTMDLVARLLGKSLESAETPPESTDLTLLKKSRILIVDDDVLNRKILSKLLASLGLINDTAENGYEAVQAAKHTPYDFIFMDCNMPIMDGFEAAEIIKGLNLKNVPKIVALTGNVFDEDRDRCLSSGMDYFLPKPIDRKALEQLFQDILQGSKDDALDKAAGS